MKIRSFSQLQDYLDSETSWRKRELSFLRIELRDQREKKVEFVIRSSIALSYAHLEGFVKNSATALLAYLSFVGLRRQEVARKLVNSYLFSQIGKFGELKSSEVFSTFIEHALDVRCTDTLSWDPKKLVRTRSNLRFEEFSEILLNVGLNAGKYDLKKAKIDSLVALRNSIAHGEKPLINLDEAVEYVDIVQGVIDGVKSDVINFIALQEHRAAPITMPYD